MKILVYDPTTGEKIEGDGLEVLAVAAERRAKREREAFNRLSPREARVLLAALDPYDRPIVQQDVWT